MRHARLCLVLMLAAVACSPDASTAPGGASRTAEIGAFSRVRSRYLVEVPIGGTADGLEPAVAAAGGRVDRSLAQIGVAVVSSTDPAFADLLGAMGFLVAHDIPLRVRSEFALDEAEDEGAMIREEDLARSPVEPPAPAPIGSDRLLALQWHMQAIHAPAAWALGYRGRGVRVAVLDNGFAPNHPDLSPNVNRALSTSFIEGERYDLPVAAHGTHVAGIVGAAMNDLGVIGVAPEAELVLIKVISPRDDGLRISAVTAGILHATDVGASVINMSFGVSLPKKGAVTVEDNGTPNDPSDDVEVGTTREEVRTLARIWARALQYAHEHGVTLVAAASNDATDFDAEKELYDLPTELPHVITVAATAPVGWAIDPTTNLDLHAPYAGTGRRYVTFAAPGGASVLRTAPPRLCVIAGVPLQCWRFDNVTSTVPAGWGQLAGCSMAAPHVAGVAALIVGKHGGRLAPGVVEAGLRASADDLGEPGRDELFGYGRVNALRAVQ